MSAIGGVLGGVFLGASIVLGLVLSSAVRIAAEWEKGIVFRLGKYHSQRGPGIFGVMPFFDAVKMVDTRIRTLEIPHRQAITKDNVPVRIDGVIFMRVDDPAAAVIRVQNFEEAVQEYAQTALRDIVGSTSLDDILADREALGRKVEEMVEVEIDGWGIEVAGIRIQDIELPEDLKRVMARQASAEREKRATITKAEGDREAAENLAEAARTMSGASGALQLRTLQTLDGLGTSPSNTVVLAVPTEVFEALRTIPALAKAIDKKE
jgi:regulator of protease activity HflC (stomatin/prohibitin superfamily)